MRPDLSAMSPARDDAYWKGWMLDAGFLIYPSFLAMSPERDVAYGKGWI
jgi:hypothetical protein